MLPQRACPGVIYQELGRCGMEAEQEQWLRIARQGFCTMCPHFGRWLKICCGEQVGRPGLQHMLRLDYAFQMVFPKETEIKRQHHSADFDALMTRMLYVEALSRVAALRGGH